VAGAITNLPQGLIGLLQLRDYGATPQGLAPDLVATVDLTQQYLLNRRETVIATGVAAAIGGVATNLVVPPGEVWYVWEMLANTAPGAGAAARIAPAIQFVAAGVFHTVGPYQTVAANEDLKASMTDGPRYVGPGGVLAFNCQSQTLAPTVLVAAVITRLKA
jgi:hypothetical protein